MKDIKSKIFRKAGALTIVRGGQSLSANGVITEKEEKIENCESTAFGVLSVPLYTYMGDTELRKGDTINSGEESFLVIQSDVIEAFGISFCARALLERIL